MSTYYKMYFFHVKVEELPGDFEKDRFTIILKCDLEIKKKKLYPFSYEYKVPRHILEDIGPAELAKRVYNVFKNKTSRCSGQANINL